IRCLTKRLPYMKVEIFDQHNVNYFILITKRKTLLLLVILKYTSSYHLLFAALRLQSAIVPYKMMPPNPQPATISVGSCTFRIKRLNPISTATSIKYQ